VVLRPRKTTCGSLLRSRWHESQIRQRHGRVCGAYARCRASQLQPESVPTLVSSVTRPWRAVAGAVIAPAEAIHPAALPSSDYNSLLRALRPHRWFPCVLSRTGLDWTGRLPFLTLCAPKSRHRRASNNKRQVLAPTATRTSHNGSSAHVTHLWHTSAVDRLPGTNLGACDDSVGTTNICLTRSCPTVSPHCKAGWRTKICPASPRDSVSVPPVAVHKLTARPQRLCMRIFYCCSTACAALVKRCIFATRSRALLPSVYTSCRLALDADGHLLIVTLRPRSTQIQLIS
jgi:hypothetical protein